jgi:hypothetical protein
LRYLRCAQALMRCGVAVWSTAPVPPGVLAGRVFACGAGSTRVGGASRRARRGTRQGRGRPRRHRWSARLEDSPLHPPYGNWATRNPSLWAELWP